MLDALDSFTGMARRIGPNVRQRQQIAPAQPRRARGGSGVDAKAVREWAKSQGITSNERGRLSTDVVQQYLAATG